MSLIKYSLTRALQLTGISMLSLYSINAAAYGSVGIGAGYAISEYKDYDNDIQPIPLVQLSGERFYFRGMSAGAYLYKDSVNEISLAASYSFQEFDPDNSDDISLKLLNKRNATAMIDMIYRLSYVDVGTVSFIASADILDETDGGYKFNLDYRHNLHLSKLIRIAPGFGFTWFNDALTDHYYGISANEASISGLNEYHPESDISPYLNIAITAPLYKQINLFANGRYTFLSDEITNSPMVDREHAVSVTLGVNYSF